MNAIAILSEDRFLARGAFSPNTNPLTPLPNNLTFQRKIMLISHVGIVGWSNTVTDPGFGGAAGGDQSIKSKLINLMTSIRTLMRSTCSSFHFFYLHIPGKYISGQRALREETCEKRNGNWVGLRLTKSTVPLIGINTVIFVYELIFG